MSPSAQPPRVVVAAAHALDAARNQQMKIVILNKTLFFADLFALRDLGHLITGSKYVALKMGPVVANYDRKIVKKMRKLGLAEQLSLGMAKPLKLTGDVPSGVLGDEEVDYVRAVAEKLAGKRSADVSEFSHENVAWRLAYEAGQARGEQACVVNLHLALQQIVDADPWLNQDDDAQAREALSRVGHDVEHQWD